MVLDACKRASATEANAREATEALRKQLEYVPTYFSRHSTSIYFQLQVRKFLTTTFSCRGALPTPHLPYASNFGDVALGCHVIELI